MTRLLRTMVAGLGAVWLASIAAQIPWRAADATVEGGLHPEQRHGQIARKVTDLIEYYHYRQRDVDDELSSMIFQRYLEALDSSKMYLLASDMQALERHRYELDDAVSKGQVDSAFEIFNLYQQRTRERMEYAIELLGSEQDFTVDETYTYERSDEPWPVSRAELDELWRKRVKNDAISLLLAGKSWPEASKILAERYERVLKRVSQINSDDVFEIFMNAFAGALDPHSTYLSPRNSEEYRIQMSLSYDGIGASLQLDEDYVTIMNVIPGGPAAIDGTLKQNDRVTAVGQGPDGDLIDVIGWRLDDVVQLIRGPGGTQVRLQILPAGVLPGTKETLITLTRDKVKLEAQAAQRERVQIHRDGREWAIGVISVPSFYQDYASRAAGAKDFRSTHRDVQKLIKELKAEGIDGLIIDLRGNGGGHLTEARDLVGLFIDKGPVVQLRSFGGAVETLQDSIPAVAYDGSLAVLVDRFSASASEIFAAAIQDYGRGIVIGQQTFGKGSVQNLYSLDRFARERDPGFGQLTLTIGKYYRVSGDSTQHRGVEPDIALPSLIDSREIGESTRETALPWDRIEATPFRSENRVHDTIAALEQSHAQRALANPDFSALVDGIESYADLRDRRTVSLSLQQREVEREELQQARLQRENARRAAHGLAPLESVEALENVEEPDVILSEAAQIVADLASFQATQPYTAQTDSR